MNLYGSVVTTYTIGEVADRSGFSSSALRYYEGIGLVPPSARSDAGYRLYDDHTLARLAFIARAKQLGCSLGEIADLVAVWDDKRCAPVQRHFHDLVTAKRTEAHRQITELTALIDQLQAAASQLAGPAIDGPCDDTCACVGPSAAPPDPVAIALEAKPSPSAIACTLDATAMGDRVADWQRLVAAAGARTTTADGGLRIQFSDTTQVAELARLVAAEQGCCAFFAFTITIDDTGVALEVRAPDGAAAMIDSLFGVPA